MAEARSGIFAEMAEVREITVDGPADLDLHLREATTPRPPGFVTSV